ncbi:MAG: histidine phosphatase family protein [Roseburia sp.]|nr:histidine phosphatase family protein [Roseburia sp.]
MKDLFLIRHGRQSSKRCNVDVGLDEAGKRQAELLADRLTGYQIEKLYCSGLKRAVQTADIIGNALGLCPEKIEDFREIDFGTMTGKEDDVIVKEYGEFRRERAMQTSDLSYPGGENGADVIRRVMPHVEEICRRPERRAAIVTHGGVIRALCAHLTQTPMKNKLKFAIDMENTAITQICYDEDKNLFYLERFNDFSHLEKYPELLRNNWKSSFIRR